MSRRIDLTRFRLCEHPLCVKGSVREGFRFCPLHQCHHPKCKERRTLWSAHCEAHQPTVAQGAF